MTTIAVVAVPRYAEELHRAAHDGTLVCVMTGGDRAYLLVQVEGGRLPDQLFVDPIDGELLVETRSFSTEAAARAWVSADFASRLATAGWVH